MSRLNGLILMFIGFFGMGVGHRLRRFTEIFLLTEGREGRKGGERKKKEKRVEQKGKKGGRSFELEGSKGGMEWRV